MQARTRFIPTLQTCVVAWVRGGKKQNLTTLRELCVCVCACGSERKVTVVSLCRLVHAGVFSSPPSPSYPNNREDPHFDDSYLSDNRKQYNSPISKTEYTHVYMVKWIASSD